MPEPGTALGPLTTTFTVPPQCTIAIAGNPHAWMGQSCVKSKNIADATTCWPPVARNVPDPGTMLAGWGFYSPGVQCPAGHTSACSATAGDRNGFPFQFSLAARETAVGCCPVGFYCTVQDSGWQTCVFDSEKSSAEIQTVSCDQTKGESVGLGVVTMPQARFTVWAPLIQLNFQLTDLPAVSSSTSTTPAPSASNSAPASSESSGISTAAIAGIAVGAAVVVLGIFGAAFFIWRRKRAQRRETGFSQFGAPNQGGGGDAASAQYYTQLGTYPQGQDLHQLHGDGVASPAYSDRSRGAVVPVAGGNGMQEGKYYYSSNAMSNAVEADSRSAAVEAPAGTNQRPTELAG